MCLYANQGLIRIKVGYDTFTESSFVLLMTSAIRGVIKNFLAQSASDYQGMKMWSLIVNIIPFQGTALSPSLFELAYPFQIEVFLLVPQVLVHCLYDAFIASKLCSTKVGFQFWEQTEVRKGPYQENMGLWKDFESIFSRSSHGSLLCVSRRIVLQEQNTSSRVLG